MTLLPIAVLVYDLAYRTPVYFTDEGKRAHLRDQTRTVLPPDHYLGWSIRTRLKGDVFETFFKWLEKRRVDTSRVMLGAMRHTLYLDEDGDAPASIARPLGALGPKLNYI